MLTNITACIIYREEDSAYLKDCLESINSIGMPIVLMKTLPKSKERIIKSSVLITDHDNVKYCEYYYEADPEASHLNMLTNKFSFADARNACKSFAETEWILSIDADERLCAVRSEFDILDKLPPSIIAVTTKLHNHIDKAELTSFEAGAHNIPRIFRKQYDWFMRIHEQIIPPQAGTDNLYRSSIFIKHIGYSQYGNIVEKHLRNTALCAFEVSQIKDLTRLQRHESYIVDKLIGELTELFQYPEFSPGKVPILNAKELSNTLEFLKSRDVAVSIDIEVLIKNLRTFAFTVAQDVTNKTVLWQCFHAVKLYYQLMTEVGRG